ncbi:uncharacterized protein LOC124500481 [Dermatophagoides farinae]|uniref:uncharacterized protein LOC124500481 n=1 Tax=Dermatophagoides farinae TaxID=6954 RepID=UPI003F60D4B4
MDKEKNPSQVTIISDRFQSLESEISRLIGVVDKKNVTLNDLNFHNQNLTKENNEIKMELSNIRTNCHDQLLSLKNLLHNEPNANDQIINMIDKIIENTNSNRAISNDQDVFIEMIESKSKLFQCENELPCLRDKNEILEKIIESKTNYMNDLQKFTSEQREKHETIVESLKNELKIQNQTNDKTRLELEDSRSKCQTLEIQLNESKQQIAGLTNKLQTNEENYQKIHNEFEEKYQIKINECDNLRLEIEQLNAVFEKSKTEMLEKYLEKFYPNISMFSHIFDRNRSISQLYSQFLQTETMNKNLVIEKSVLEERVQSLSKQLDDMEQSTATLMKEIQRVKRMEDKMLKIEIENKELAISLKFYKNSALSLHNGAKMFHDNFQNLSKKIDVLVKHETNQINDQNTVPGDGNDDSTGMLALKYVMELQNKFQEFHQLQTEFEKQKLNFINEKQNIIENENRIDLLTQRLEMLEMEKQQWQVRNDLLHSEYEVLKSLMANMKTESRDEKIQSQRIINDLQAANESLRTSIEQSNAKLTECDAELKTLKSINDELERQRKLQSEKLVSMEKQSKSQSQRLKQLEQSNNELRKMNETLQQSKDMAEKNWHILSEQAADYRQRSLRMEIELNSCKSELESLKQRQRYFVERLSSLYNDTGRTDRLAIIIESLTENKCLIDDELLHSIGRMKMDHENLSESFEKQREQWNNEKLIFIENVSQLETNLRNEINRNLELENRFLSQHQQQDNEMAERFEVLTKELNELKQKRLTSNHENQELLQEKLRIESEFAVVNAEKSRLLAEINLVETESKMKINQQQSKMTKEIERYQQELQDLQTTVLMAKNLSIEILEKKIEIITKTNEELQKELSLNKSDKYQQELRLSQMELESLREKTKRLKQQADEWQKQHKNEQIKLIELKREKSTESKRYDERLKALRSNVEQLHSEKLELIQANEKLNHDLGQSIRSLQNNDPDVSTLKNVIENLTGQNKSLLDKLKTFDLHDERHQNEMDSMRMTIINLEQSVQREKHEYEQMKQLLMKQQECEQKTRKSTMQENEFQEYLQKIRNDNDELSRKCQQLSIEIERLHQEDSREKVADAGMIATLQSRLQQAESYAHELETKLSELNVKHQKSEQESIEIRAKYQQQTLELESLRKELATMQEKSSKQHDESEKQIESIRNELSSLQTMNHQLKNLARKYKSQCEQYQKQQQLQQSGSKDNQQQQQQQLDTDNKNELETRIQNLQSENEKLREKIEQLEQEINQLQQQAEQSRQKARSIGQQAKNRLSNMDKLLNERDKEINFLRSILSDKSKIMDPSSNVVTGDQPSIAGSSHNNTGQSVSSTIVSASSNHNLHRQQQPSTSSSSSSSTTTMTSTTKILNLINRHQPTSSSGSHNEDHDLDNNRLQSAQISSHTTSMMDDNSMESIQSSTSTFFPATTNIPSTSSMNNLHKRRFQSSSNDDHPDIGLKIAKKKRNDNNTDTNSNMVDSGNQMVTIQQQQQESSHQQSLDNPNSGGNDEEDEMQEEAGQSSSSNVIQIDDDDDDDDNDQIEQNNEQEQIVDQSHQQLEPEDQEEEDHHTESNDGSYPFVVNASSSNNNDDNNQ